MLEAPDGTTHHTVIAGFEMLAPPHPDILPAMLDPETSKRMVPIGTKIWLSAQHLGKHARVEARP